MTRRLVSAAIALLTLMLLVLGIPFLRTIENYERERLRRDLVGDAVVIGATVEDELSDETPTDIVTQSVALQYFRRTGARVVIVDLRGMVRADTATPSSKLNSTGERRSMAGRPEIQTALNGEVVAVTRNSTSLGYSSLFVAVPVSSAGQVLGAVRVSFPTKDVNRRIAVHRTRLIAFGLGMMAVVSMLSIWLARKLVQPIVALQNATRLFGNGKLDTRANAEDGPDDIRRLANEFNTMAERIDDVVNTQQAFVADASHELRSPLTAIRLQLEAMEYTSGDDLERRRTSALEEVTRLSRNVDGLLVLARQDAPTRVTQTINLATIVTNRAEFWEPLITERELRLITDIKPNLMAVAVSDRVMTVLDNLISNAIDAAPAHSSIVIAAKGVGKQIEIHVIDGGIGMSASQRIEAFNRFWRANANRQQPTLGGSGLGLAISRKLVAMDLGTIRLDEAPGSGIDAVVCYRKAIT
jgi:signal transduction histidine kinase